MNAISSMDAVTAGPAECRCATTPATSSTSFMITPPCTLPSRFVSSTVMIRLSAVRAAEVGFDSCAPSTPLFDHECAPGDARGARHGRPWLAPLCPRSFEVAEGPLVSGKAAGRTAYSRYAGDRERSQTAARPGQRKETLDTERYARARPARSWRAITTR